MSREIANATANTLIPAYGKEDLYSTPVTTLFASTNNTTPTNTVTGFITALQQASQAYSSPPANNNLLYPVVWNSRLTASNQLILLKSATFYAIDSLVTGGSGADPAVITAIETSLNDPRAAYVSSRFANGILPTSGVNLFRPKITFNNSNIILDASQVFSAKTNNNIVTSPSATADATVGFALPYTIHFNMFIKLPINTIEIYAQCGQYITSESKWQMYPVFCEINFGLRDDTLPPKQQPTTTTTTTR